MNKFRMLLPLFTLNATIVFVLIFAGCQKRRESDNSVFAFEETEYQVVVAIDLSGSFLDEMADNGRAYQFILQLVDKYFRDRIGTADRLVIAQISGNDRALLWEGTPLALRKEFSNTKSFRDFLYSKSDAGSSRVYENLTHTLEYVLDESPTTTSSKKALFVLSDMADNASGPDAEKNLTQRIVDFTEANGLVGLYYVNQSQVIPWREKLRSAGAKNFCVESEIVSRPALPNFE